MKKLAKLASLLCAPALLTACAKDIVAIASEPFCTAVKPVCVSKEDVLTEGTAQQIEANELGRAPICGPPPPCEQAKPQQATPATS